MTIEFGYKGEWVVYELNPQESDWWESDGRFDYHYDKDDNSVCVYPYEDYQRPVYKCHIKRYSVTFPYRMKTYGAYEFGAVMVLIHNELKTSVARGVFTGDVVIVKEKEGKIYKADPIDDCYWTWKEVNL